MKFQVSDGEQYQKVMEAEIPAQEMELAIRQASKRLAAKVNIPGFRKGKAPQSIIENFVGIDSILQEAADELLPRAYFQGLSELELDPVDQPKIEMVSLSAHEPMVFKATFTIKPQVQLGQYQGLALTKYIREVTDADVDADIETQRQRMGRTVDAEEGAVAAEQDIVNIDFEGFREGVPFEGGKAEKYSLTLGSQSFIPGFEEQLIGMRVGGEQEINVTFPEDYQEQSLAGQPVVFKVKVHEIKRRVLPELDDDFAQEVSESAENMEALRRETKERLEQRNLDEANNEARENALKIAVENTKIDLPPVMVEQRLDSMIQNMADRLQAQGLEMEQFLAYTGQNAAELRENYREQADYSVRRDLVLEEVAKVENISVSDAEVDAELEMMAAHYWQPLEQIRELMMQNNRMAVLTDDIKMKKATDLIFAAAEVKEEVAPPPQAAAEETKGEDEKPKAKKVRAKKTAEKKDDDAQTDE